MKKNLLSAAVKSALSLTAAALLVPAMPAFAQDKEENAQVDEIVVTGSRIPRISEIAPTPVTVMTGDFITNAGVTNVADLLHKMPNTMVGLSPETTNNTIFASGLNNTDLRGLGSSRTLVLVNGRRFVSGAPGSAAVDLNNIPTAMIDRVEITTGGASAVYGSDAVAGVVNIITKKSFDGVSLDMSTSQPSQSGGEEEYMSLTFGQDLDKLSYVSNLSLARQKQISFMDRDFLRDAPIVVRNPRSSEGDFDPVNEPAAIFWGLGQQVMRQYQKTGTIHAPGGNFTFTDDGQVRDMVCEDPLPALTSGRVDCNGGDGYSFAENSFIRTPLDRANFVSNLAYQLADNHQVEAELNLSRSEAYGESSPVFMTFAARPDNPFLSAEAVDRMGGTTRTASLLTADLGNRIYSQERTTARLALGFNGSLTDTWRYDAYVSAGHVQADTEWTGEMYYDRMLQALDATTDESGNVVCRDTSNGCAPLNMFGRDQYSQEAYDWVTTDAVRESSIQQNTAGITFSGFLMELPAGPLGAAFSAEYREETAKTQPDEAMQQGLLFGNQSDPLKGSFDVAEVAAEFSIPLLAGLPFVENLTLETAVRSMDYSTSGSDTAWKYGLNWEVSEELRVRFNKSKSVRAPNIAELYNPRGQTFRTVTDYCALSRRDQLDPKYRENILANCAAQGIPTDFEPSQEWHGSTRPGFIIGNEDLTNEIANDYTVGFVYTPNFIEDFSLTVDYWKFDIENMIQSFTGPDLVRYCYQSSSLDNVFCPLIERDPETHEIVNYFEKPINSALSTTAGVDIEANYNFDTSFGGFGVRWIGTYLEERSFNQTGFAEDELVLTGEQSRPRWRNRLITDYSYGDFTAVLTGTHRHSTVLDNYWTVNQNDYNDVPSYITWDLTSRYVVSDNLEVRAGVLNMFDKTPPRRPSMYSQGAYYDMLGQRLTVGFNYTF